MGLARSSGIISATAGTNIAKGRNILSGLMVVSDNVNTASVTVYDNALGDTSGLVLARLSATVTTGANSLAFVTPICAENGLSVSVTGTGAPQAIVYFGA
jgi:hypothetical protein